MAYIGKSPTGTGVRSRYYFTATAGATSLSGADDNSNTLVFSDGNYVDVSLNGVALVAGTDYNTSTTNTIAGLSALSASDIVEVVVYDIFTVADTVSAKDGGTFSGNVAMGGTLAVTGASTMGGTLAVTGASTLSSTLGVTGKITSTAGITFGSDTAATNVLDDYEEGSWTPIITGSSSAGSCTYSSQLGRYVKIGKQVSCWGTVASSSTPTGTGNLQVAGLPFSKENSILPWGTETSIAYFFGLSSYGTATDTLRLLGPVSGGTYARFHSFNNRGDTSAPPTPANFVSGANLYFSVTYEVQ